MKGVWRGLEIWANKPYSAINRVEATLDQFQLERSSPFAMG